MAITGNLRTMQLSELLQWLSMGQKTGTLVIRGSPGEKRIYFDRGRIVSSSSTVEREYLGHFLVALGYITEVELTRAMEVQEESKILLGKILVMIGAISEDDLTAILRQKAAETIYDIFLWTEGAFEFVDGEVPRLPMVPMSVDVTGIVMEGLRRYDEWARIRTRLRSLGEIPAIVAPIDVLALSPREQIVVKAIDGLRSVSEIAAATHNSDFFLAGFVFLLLDQKKAEIVGKRVAPDSSELTLDNPQSMVFEEAQESPFEEESPQADETVGFPPPPQEKPSEPIRLPPHGPSPQSLTTRLVPAEGTVERTGKAPAGEFARFLRRGPDSSTLGRKSPPSDGSASFKGLIDQSTITRVDGKPAKAPSSAASSASMASSASSVSSADLASAARIRHSAIPVLNRPMEELISYSFTPNEAFILSRVNGLWDVRSIQKISPFPETEVLRVFRKLEDGGVISWR